MNSCRNCFVEVKSSKQNPVSFQDFFVPLASSQSQVQVTPFYGSTAPDLVQHSVPLQKLRALVLQDICAKIFTAVQATGNFRTYFKHFSSLVLIFSDILHGFS